MGIAPILTIIIIHWIADFILQDEKWAVGKSKNMEDLLLHTSLYSATWFIPILYLNPLDIVNTLLFVLITFVAHTSTDYITSRIVSKKFERKELGSPIPNIGAFSIIGFDQVLHYVQLVLTYSFLFLN